MNKQSYPTEPPAIGGWYYDEKRGKTMFLMPPYPGVDDCVRVGRHWAYRNLWERDQRREAAVNIDNIAILVDDKRQHVSTMLMRQYAVVSHEEFASTQAAIDHCRKAFPGIPMAIYDYQKVDTNE